MNRYLGALCIILTATAAYAELKLPAVFSAGMVFQRGQAVPVWGWAEPGAEVKISFADQHRTVKADQTGKFRVELAEMKASREPQSLIVVSETDSKTIKNVLVGEVWLCSGQSNMAWPMKQSLNFEEERATANYPLIRMFLIPLETAQEPQEVGKGAWRVCSPEQVGNFSAVAYFFGRELFEELDVPIGLIRSSYGGSRIEAWSPMESLKPFPRTMAHQKNMDRQQKLFEDGTLQKTYETALIEWEQKAEQARAEGQEEPRRLRKPVSALKSQNYPANLYNVMIHPLIPYGIRGAIWYQGEANTHSVADAMVYRDLLENMVTEWRKGWTAEFPFYAVQLVNFKAPSKNAGAYTSWAPLRESCLSFSQNVPNTGIAVGIDVGEADDIHPKNKQAIGYRLALQALVKTYQQNRVAEGPIYRSMKRRGQKIVLSFDSVGGGLVAHGGEPLRRFEVAGADQKFVWAQAEIKEDTVVVFAPEISKPVAVRYAWADNPEGCNLFNKAGLPATPFRTDDWPLATK